ncbi:MAG TPA: tetratricopeptide repeat protein [Bacteroidales bacterium]|nr:tetratricopeptide repeat protein [Bacteroidales bacterium]
MKILNRHYILTILCLFVISSEKAISQDKVTIDSLLTVINHATSDSTKIKSLLDLSAIYFAFDYSKALEYAGEAKKAAAEARLKKWESKADNAFGNVYISTGDYKLASRYYFGALHYYESINDSLNIIRLQTNLGALYDRLEDYDKALSYYFRVLELFNLIKNPNKKEYPLTSLYNNIANIYQTKGDTTSALQYYRKSLQKARETNNKPAQGIVLNNLGKLYLTDLNRPKTALPYLIEGLQVRESNGDKAEIARSMIILCDYYLRQGNASEAGKYARKIIALASEVGSIDLKSKAYQQLSAVEEMQGNTKDALENYKLFKAYSDSIQKQYARSEIERLQMQYDFEKAEKIREADTRQARIRYLVIIIALAIGLLVTLLITRIISIRAKENDLKQKALAGDIEIKNKELTTNVMYLVKKNELINSIAERLLKVNHQLPVESQAAIHDIIIELEKEGDSDSWKEFELRFNQVHLEFYNKLRQKHTGLTPSDEKLCAFLRLNMNTKEIAAITKQQIKTIEVARARLRKKLNLTNSSANLVTYLMNL